MSNKLKEERRRRRWRIGYIAEVVGVADEKTVRRWENEVAMPSPVHVRKLCQLFEMTAEELGLNKDASK